MPVALRFRFDDFRREVELLFGISRRFLDASAEWIFPQLLEVLDQIRTSGRQDEVRWEVQEQHPLRTVETDRFEPGNRRGGLVVIGEVSWCWDIRPVRPRRGKPSEFEVNGIASAKLRIRSKNDDPPDGIAMWRVELGATDSPGCYFHSQILGETDHPPFPHALSVPRLPSLFVTPMAAVEFLLSELFQDEWEQHVVGDQGNLPFWSRIQQQRLRDLFRWKQKQIEGCQGSPWVALKKAKPEEPDELFVG